jgi:hypothetical protein
MTIYEATLIASTISTIKGLTEKISLGYANGVG